MKATRRFVARVLIGAPLGFVVGVLATVALPALFGWQSLTVMSGSMEPTIPTGSVVVVERIHADQIVPGDVITFRDPEDSSRLQTHRVRSVTAFPEGLVVVTQGDANSGTETWSIAPDGSVGRVKYHVPHLGYLLRPMHSSVARLAMVVLPALGLTVVIMMSIWRPTQCYLKLPPLETLYAQRIGRPQQVSHS